MNRFFDIKGDKSTQLAPWQLKERGYTAGSAIFVLEEPLRMVSSIAKGTLVVPAGFESDLASIPSWAYSIFMSSDDPRIELASWFHDLLYKNKGVVILESGDKTALTREQSDAILCFEGMYALGASTYQRSAVYLALRAFGDRWS